MKTYIFYDKAKNRFKLVIFDGDTNITYYVNDVIIITPDEKIELVKDKNDIYVDAKIIAIANSRVRRKYNYGEYAEIRI